MKRIKLNEEMESLIEAISGGLNVALARFDKKEANFATLKLPESADPRALELQDLTKLALSDDRDNYFKGVPCYACAGENEVDGVMSYYKDKDQMTLSCLFQNGSLRYMPELVSKIKGRNIIMIAPWNALCVQNPHFPLNIRYVFRYKQEAFSIINLSLDIKRFIDKHDIKKYIFMFADRPNDITEVNELNVLINELHKHSSENSYINIGNVFDTIFYGTHTKPWQDLKNQLSFKNCVFDYIGEEK